MGSGEGRNYSRYNDYQGDRSGTKSGENKGCQIFVGNLPYTTTWQELKDAFKICGNVIRADIPQDYRGRSKGFGIVLFESNEEAQKAIEEMNNTELNGRNIYVKLDE